MSQQKQKSSSSKFSSFLPVIYAIIGFLFLSFLWWNGGLIQNEDPAPAAAEPTAAALLVVATDTPPPPPTEEQPADEATEQPAAQEAATQPAEAPTPAPVATRASDLPAIAYADLPPEAHDTIALIDQGGPFPYDKDGSTFQNREGILPDKRSGYYGEYTVITPGSPDRGARRIIAGNGGELYYTDDHYDSFSEVIR